MTKERIPISGDLKSKVKQLMEYAGWYEGRSVDISLAEQYYADHGVPMMKTTQRFYRKYFGLCCEWYLEQRKLNWAADFQFALFPYLVNGIKNHLEEAYFRDMSGCELAEIEQAAGEKCQPIGQIGYYYPAEVWISECGKLYAKYEYQDEIECFPDVFALIERELRQCKLDSAAMNLWRHWMENFESLEIGDSIMSDWAQIISDALDILKFDGAVQDTLAELRRKWSGQIPALLEERFDTLGIQYMKLPPRNGAWLRWDRSCPLSAGRCMTWTRRTSICLP